MSHFRLVSPFTAAVGLLAAVTVLSGSAATRQQTAQEAPAAPSAPVTAPELLNERGCLHCHTFNAHGGDKGPDLSAVGKRLKGPAIREQIVNGGKSMPAFGEALTQQERDALVEFLQHARKPHK